MKTTTYGSEFVVARTATQWIIDFYPTLMYVGVPVNDKVYMFIYNKTVVDSDHAKLQKRHTALLCYHIKEGISRNRLNFIFIPVITKPADIL